MSWVQPRTLRLNGALGGPKALLSTSVTPAGHTSKVQGAATTIHADLDAFYASVEVRDDPSLQGRPIAVGGGVILSATYEARRFGVRSAMTGSEARRRCPGLRIVPARFSAYVSTSRLVMEVFDRFTPIVEPISIDEAFLDVSGTAHLFGPPITIAQSIRRVVLEEVGLPISVGIATTKHLAKIASRVAKPNGLVAVDPGEEEEFLRPLPVGMVWGVGPVAESNLARFGITTIGDLADLPRSTLAGWLGQHWGSHLWHLAHNHDPRPVERSHGAGSVGAQSAGRGTDVEARHRTLLSLADRIGVRLRRKHQAGRRVTVRVRFDDMSSVTRAITLPGPIAETTALYRQAARLADALVAERGEGRQVTLVGISVSQLHKTPHIQMELALDGLDEDPSARAGSEANLRLHDLDTAVDEVRQRYGRSAVHRAAIFERGPEARSPTDELEVNNG